MTTTQPVAHERGPYRKSEKRRADILDSALEVFARSGYNRGSLRSVAERVGMSEAGLLHHFGSKGRLLAAVLERRDDVAQKILYFDAPGPVVLRQAVELARVNTESPGAIELFVIVSAEATAPEHPAREYFHQRYATLVRGLETAFQDLHEHGWLVSTITPRAAAVGTVAMWDGLQLQWLHLGRNFDLPANLEHYLQALLIHPIPGSGSELSGYEYNTD